MPAAMMKPIWASVVMLENCRPTIEAAKIRPAAVMTPPVWLTVRITPDLMPCGDSSLIRDISSRL